MNRCSISVVIPVHNEPGTVGCLVEDLGCCLTEQYGPAWEIVVVDDGSRPSFSLPDAVDRSHLRVITLPRRGGSGHARRIGSREARGDLIGWIDADGTYRASDLCRLAGELRDGDQVIGARSGDFGRLRLVRLLTKAATFSVASRLWQTPIPDLNSGVRVFRRHKLLEFLDELPDGFSCTSTATLAALNRGHRIAFVPIAYLPRSHGQRSKFHPLWDTLRLWRVVLRQWRRRHRVVAESDHLPYAARH